MIDPPGAGTGQTGPVPGVIVRPPPPVIVGSVIPPPTRIEAGTGVPIAGATSVPPGAGIGVPVAGVSAMRDAGVPIFDGGADD